MKQVKQWLWKTVKTSVMAVAFIVPVYLFIAQRLPSGPPRLQVAPAFALDQARERAIDVPGYKDVVPALLYDRIADSPGSVTPAEFAAQMRKLHDEHFNPITADQLVSYLLYKGKLPSRPVLIAFDVGVGDLWRKVDPVLQSLDFQATLFLKGNHVGTHLPYYLSRQDVRAMLNSGRWDFEATSEPHGIELLLQRFQGFGAPPPVAFLYNRHAPRNANVERIFQVSFTAASVAGHFISRADRPFQRLPLLHVRPGVQPLELVGAITNMLPLQTVLVNGMTSARDWKVEGDKQSVLQHQIRFGFFRSDTPAQDWLAAYYAPARTYAWANYTTQLRIGNLGEAGAGGDATLILGVEPTRASVTISSNRGSVETARGKTRWQIPAASEHLVSVSLYGPFMSVNVDDTRVYTGPGLVRGGVGLGVWREQAASPSPVFGSLIVGPNEAPITGGANSLISTPPASPAPRVPATTVHVSSARTYTTTTTTTVFSTTTYFTKTAPTPTTPTPANVSDQPKTDDGVQKLWQAYPLGN